MSVIVLSPQFSKFRRHNAQLQGTSRLVIGHTDMGTNNYNVGIVVAEVCRVGDRERLEGVWNASALGRQGLNQEKP